jgi:hydrogenase maturation protease
MPEAPGVAPIAVVGLGNVLMGDDAFGPYVVQVLLAGYAFPPEVEVLDLGTPGLDLTPHVSDRRALVLIDTVHSSGQPGELRSYTREDVLRHPPQTRLSPHDPGVKEALLLAEVEGRGPEQVRLIGVIPATTGTGVGLSPAVEAAVPETVARVIAMLEELGVRVSKREPPAAPDLWWLSPAGPAGEIL